MMCGGSLMPKLAQGVDLLTPSAPYQLQTSVPSREPTQPMALMSGRLADAVVKDFITSPQPLMPGISHDVDLLDACPDPMELSDEPQDFSAIPAASSHNVNIFGEILNAAALLCQCCLSQLECNDLTCLAGHFFLPKAHGAAQG